MPLMGNSKRQFLEVLEGVGEWKDNIKMNRKCDGVYGMGSCGSGQGPVAGCCEHGNEFLGCIRFGDFPVRNYKLFKNDCARE